MKPPHKHFFSSLKQVEKRLKLEDGNPRPPPPPLPPPQTETQPPESSISSPIYFHNQHTNTLSTLHDNSLEQPPQEFLSINDINEFESNPNEKPPQSNNSETNFSGNSTVGDIDSMIQLLRLSDSDGKAPEMPDLADDEFYDKIVKVKGPKCKKEVERLDNWINYLLNNGAHEPLRLAHLLMAKAAFVTVDDDGFEFPRTVDEFLQKDPPSD